MVLRKGKRFAAKLTKLPRFPNMGNRAQCASLIWEIAKHQREIPWIKVLLNTIVCWTSAFIYVLFAWTLGDEIWINFWQNVRRGLLLRNTMPTYHGLQACEMRNLAKSVDAVANLRDRSSLRDFLA